MAIIEVEHVTKEYRLGAMESLKNIASRMMGRNPPDSRNFKALDDVCFSIEQGEVVGIIGHNGAGKSTLLKMLCRIATPTSGAVTVRGRVAPLIEVGAGLVGEMTGRENIYLNATILGMRRAEIDGKVDEIIAFSELEQFIDTPIKRYSSGMQARLGFAIATSVDAEILIVDEVLSVGDLAFQKKCFERMDELVRKSGKTVLFVSHNLRQIERMCSRAILLNHGRVEIDGVADVACEQLFNRMQTHANTTVKTKQKIESSGEIELLSVDVKATSFKDVSEIYSGDPLSIKITFNSKIEINSPSIIVGTHTPDFIYINAGNSAEVEKRPSIKIGVQSITYEIENYPLCSGIYLVRFSVYDESHRPVFIGESLQSFIVTSRTSELQKAGMKLIELGGRWTL